MRLNCSTSEIYEGIQKGSAALAVVSVAGLILTVGATVYDAASQGGLSDEQQNNFAIAGMVFGATMLSSCVVSCILRPSEAPSERSISLISSLTSSSSSAPVAPVAPAVPVVPVVPVVVPVEDADSIEMTARV